jgi:hypothetical protein
MARVTRSTEAIARHAANGIIQLRFFIFITFWFVGLVNNQGFTTLQNSLIAGKYRRRKNVGTDFTILKQACTRQPQSQPKVIVMDCAHRLLKAVFD